MRSLAEKAGFIARIRLKIDKKEYELVKEILLGSEVMEIATQSMPEMRECTDVEAVRPQIPTETVDLDPETLLESPTSGLVFNFEGNPSASQYESIFDPRQSPRHTIQMVRPIIIHGSVGGMAVWDHNAVHVGNNSVSEQTSSSFLSKMMMELGMV
ncbi:uncharacterized protein [Ptychodera flava]|uniref:uncharacterized protein n=1 Tax=Ptychodera flava TaxID=63121 RepID=UPI00396A4507